MSQLGRVISSASEVNYRDFHIVEKQSRIDVLVNSESEFLAKRIFNEVSEKPVGFWGMLGRLGIFLLNQLLSNSISYEVSTR